MFYQKDFVQKYLEALKKEILDTYQQEEIDTLYIGGGTPSSLTIEELKYLFEITNLFKKSKDCEFTIECNITDTTYEKLLLFKKNGINRISFGVQSGNSKFLEFLGRKNTNIEVSKVIKLAKEIGLNNINIDLIYALPTQTIKDLEEDLNFFINLEVPHISTYSLMIEPHTSFFIKHIEPIDDTLDAKMYQKICTTLKNNNFNHYEISNFCKGEYHSKHNMSYWNNEEYYGFGLGASGYINKKRYTNTRSFNSYIEGNRKIYEEPLTEYDIISYEMILGLRLIKGVSKINFKKKYGKEIKDIFAYKELVEKNLLEETDTALYIKEDKLYLSNEVMYHFVGSEVNE